MAVTLTTAARNAACDAIVDLLDAGNEAARIRFMLADGTTPVATLAMSDPAFGAAANGVATMDTSPTVEDTSATGSASPVTIALFESMNSGTPTEVFRCAVGTSGSDINLTNNVIAATEGVQLTSFTVTVPS
jgi:hypothetical protein